jgi:hypothetical protein
MAAAQEPARHLRAVDENTGEVFATPKEQELQALVDKLTQDRKNLEKDLRAKRRRITELERDKVKERMGYERRDDVKRIATYWHKKCRGGDKRCNPMSPDRFDAVRGLLDQEQIVVDEETGQRRREPMYTLEQFKAAIDGAAFDAFVTTRKNGSQQRHDDLELIARSSKHFEEFIAKAPRP